MTVWAFVPARGGSKSIPKKNVVSLRGVPLLDYGVVAAQKTGRFSRIVCSTDDNAIADRARTLGVEVDPRPEHLGGDDVAVADVVCEFLRRQPSLPKVLVLIQPTSPFLLPGHITALLDAMAVDPESRSGQTVTPVPHNSHAWNQRVVEYGRVRFQFARERMTAYNKQRKPKLYVFGNVIAVRPGVLLETRNFFAEPSVAIEVSWPYNMDVDGPDDVKLAEALLAAGLVTSPLDAS